MTFKQIELGTPEFQDALKLRTDVLRTPLGLSVTPEDLARDLECFHLGGFEGARLLAVLLLEPQEEWTVKMRQVAVFPALQRTGVGTNLLDFAETFAGEHGYRTIIAHARGTAVGFYLRLGYTTDGAEFLEQSIPHRMVTKKLSAG